MKEFLFRFAHTYKKISQLDLKNRKSETLYFLQKAFFSIEYILENNIKDTIVNLGLSLLILNS